MTGPQAAAPRHSRTSDGSPGFQHSRALEPAAPEIHAFWPESCKIRTMLKQEKLFLLYEATRAS